MTIPVHQIFIQPLQTSYTFSMSDAVTVSIKRLKYFQGMDPMEALYQTVFHTF